MFGKIPKSFNGEIDDAVLTVTEKDAARMEWPLNRRWAGVYFFLIASALVALFGRALFLGVVQGEKYDAIAKRNSIRMIPIAPPRGIIFDRFGTPLVRNLPSVGAVLVPFDVPGDSDDRSKLKENLESVLGVPAESIDAAFSIARKNPLDPILLQEKISQEAMIAFLSRQKDFPGVSLFKSAYREYPDGLIFAHVVGYEGKISSDELSDSRGEYLPTDRVGKQGVEKSYEAELRGKRGFERIEVDSLGRAKKILSSVPPESGEDVYLSIDAGLQKKATDTLQAFLESKNLKRGSVVALDPRDGSVLALVSIPGFDNNLFSEGIPKETYDQLLQDESNPLFNRAISGEYPPGSTFKPVVAAAALSEGIIDERTQIESKGGISVGNFFFGDWKAHGFTDLRHALAVSSDVYFYSIGGGYGGIPGLGIKRIKSYAERFGYGKASGIDIPGEADGFLPDSEWKMSRLKERWYIGDDYHAAIGQGFVTATPMQIVNSIAAIANGGTLYEPRLVSYTIGKDGKPSQRSPKVLRSDLAAPETLAAIREGMRLAVTEGTAQSLNSLPLEVAGKTGTAQFGTGEMTHGWFVSFAPYDDPRIAMVVLVEGQEEETYNAVPVTREIYDWYFRERLSSFGNER